jgi:hypothetical protein
VRNFDTYPNAKLIDFNFYNSNGEGYERYWGWTLMYRTTDDFQKVIDYYETSLVNNGWSFSEVTRFGSRDNCLYPGGVNAKYYKFSKIIVYIPLEPVEVQDGTVYCLFISSKFSALFDLRY